jgi:hypothetical protein
MQVTARVAPSPAAWPTLAAAAELAAGADTLRGGRRVERGLARVELAPGDQDARRVSIRVDYLRN